MAETPQDESRATGSIGARLLAAREKQGLSLAEVAERTRIAERHLLSIEEGRYDALPGRTYVFGFARSYARVVGLDEKEIVDAVRVEIDATAPPVPQRTLDYMEPGDPARIPSSRLAWGVAALTIVLIAIGIFAWRGFFVPAGELPPLTEEQVAAPATPNPTAPSPDPTAAPAGDVTFTATVDGIWVKFYDRNGAQLFQKQMALNETFTIPKDAEGPQIWTGRPDALTITIGGRAVPPLATEQRTIKDVPVDAKSLTARATATAVTASGT